MPTRLHSEDQDIRIFFEKKTVSANLGTVVYLFKGVETGPELDHEPIEDYWIFNLLDADLPVVQPESFVRLQLRVKQIRQNIRRWDPKEVALHGAEVHTANILLIGQRGAGKRSFLNTLSAALPASEKTKFKAKPSDDDATITVNSLERTYDTRIKLVDIPGWDERTPWPLYQRLMRCVIRGQATANDTVFPLTGATLVGMEGRSAAP